MPQKRPGSFKAWLNRRLGFGLLEAFLLFTVISFGIILGFDYYSATSSAREIVARLFNEHAASLSSGLGRIQMVADMLSTLARSGALSGHENPAVDWGAANKLLMPLMKDHPFVTSINYGNDKGDGYLILHVEGVWKNRIRLATDPGHVTWISLDENGNVKGMSRLRDDYDPRERPWYRIAGNEAKWSAPYVFRTTRDLGVTASVRMSGSEVLGIDIMLKDLSDMLSGLARDTDEVLAMVDSDGFIWAHSDVSKFNESIFGTDSAPKTGNKGYEQIQEAMSAYLEKGRRSGMISSDAQTFAAVTAIPMKGSKSAYLVSVGPYARRLAEFFRLSVVKMILLSILIMVFSGIFISRYLLPLRRITRAVHQYQAGRPLAPLVKDRTDEIGQLAAEFSRMTEEITERQRSLQESEKECRRLSKEFRALLDAIPDNLSLQNKDYIILWVNHAAAKQLGMSPEDVEGRRCYTLWHNKDAPCQSCPVRETFETGKAAACTVTTPDGKIWDLRTVPLKDEHGDVVNVIEVGRDITEHRKLEAQLAQAQKMEAVGLLAGGVAHDFNNILTAIIGYANLAQMGLDQGSPLRHYIQQILEASQRAVALTQSLLAFGRKQTMNLKVLDLNELVRRFQHLLRRLLREDIELKIATTEGGISVLADQGQIEQVLMNLITNARDAMPEGGRITIETNIVHLDGHFIEAHGYGRPGAYGLISVTDTGIGMDEATRRRIFDPFFTTKESGKGTGLGLAMVYGIVKKHEGFINVYSEPGRGTTFKIYLPLDSSVPLSLKDAAAAYEDAPTGSETILVAEDDKALLDLARIMLERLGYTVITAVDGADAVEKFMNGRDKIELVILDGIMPRMNGKDAYLRIKGISPDIKAIFMSGYAEDIFTKDGIPQGEAAFLQKPVSPMDLARKVREVLGGADNRLSGQS